MFWRWLWTDPRSSSIKTSWSATVPLCSCSSPVSSASRWWGCTCFWVRFQCVLRSGELSLTISWAHRCLWWIWAAWGLSRVAMVPSWGGDSGSKSSALCIALHSDILYLLTGWAGTTLEKFPSSLWSTLDTPCSSQSFLSLWPKVFLIHPWSNYGSPAWPSSCWATWTCRPRLWLLVWGRRCRSSPHASRSRIAYDVSFEICVVFAFGELGNNPGEYCEVTFAPVALYAFGLDHPRCYNGYLSILVSIFLRSD